MKTVSKQEVITIIVAIIIIISIIGIAGFRNGEKDATTTPMTNSQPQTAATSTTGLQITDVTVGTGAEAVAGKTVYVHYTGTFANGTKFDSSRDRGTPIDFVLGSGRVIKGWDQGILGMKVGGKRKLVIGPELGYGPNDYGTIPGNSTLYFDVELVDVK